MTTHARPIATCLVAGCLFLFGVELRAAKAPLNPDELKRQAAMIVAGQVIELRSKVQKSKIETGLGIHRDRVYHIRARVGAVLKGEGIKPGDEIELVAWKPVRRIPPTAGLQGHSGMPEVGDTANFYLKGKEGKAFEPILPNGIEIKKTKQKGKEDGKEKKAK